MYVTLEQIKKHLQIEPEYRDDDLYILALADAAETAVERHIDDRLCVFAEKNGGELPSPLRSAILLLIGNLYMNREPVSFAQSAEVPLTYSYLLSLYKNYSNDNLHRK